MENEKSKAFDFGEKFQRLQAANEQIQTMTFERYSKKTGKTTKKEYAEVNQRVKAFRMCYPDGAIITELIKDEDAIVHFVARVYADDMRERLLAVGHAEEVRGSSDINTYSIIENCETSAVGRALGFAGFGVDTAIASFEEVSRAELKKEGAMLASNVEKAGLIATANSKGVDIDDVLKAVGFDRDKQPEGMTAEQYGKAMAYLNSLKV